MPIVSIVVPVLVNQNLYYKILTIKLVNQKRNYNGDYRWFRGLELAGAVSAFHSALYVSAEPLQRPLKGPLKEPLQDTLKEPLREPF